MLLYTFPSCDNQALKLRNKLLVKSCMSLMCRCGSELYTTIIERGELFRFYFILIF